MEGQGLTDVPSELCKVGEIIKVDLSRNSIEELPVELSFCVSLQVRVIYISVIFFMRNDHSPHFLKVPDSEGSFFTFKINF